MKTAMTRKIGRDILLLKHDLLLQKQKSGNQYVQDKLHLNPLKIPNINLVLSNTI